MIWQNLKYGGFEGGEKIEYYKLPRRFKLIVELPPSLRQAVGSILGCLGIRRS